MRVGRLTSDVVEKRKTCSSHVVTHLAAIVRALRRTESQPSYRHLHPNALPQAAFMGITFRLDVRLC